MNPNQIELVQSSWEKVVPIAPQAAKLFYDRLFQTAPVVRSLFKTDVEQQGKKLMTIITTVVRGLRNFDKLEMTVWQLGRRHVAYGAVDVHYQVVAETLIWTLQQGLGKDFDSQTEQAWLASQNLYQALVVASK